MSQRSSKLLGRRFMSMTSPLGKVRFDGGDDIAGDDDDDDSGDELKS